MKEEKEAIGIICEVDGILGRDHVQYLSLGSLEVDAGELVRIELVLRDPIQRLEVRGIWLGPTCGCESLTVDGTTLDLMKIAVFDSTMGTDFLRRVEIPLVEFSLVLKVRARQTATLRAAVAIRGAASMALGQAIEVGRA